MTDHDAVNRPAHYRQGNFEAIDVIEAVTAGASSIKAGILHAHTLKYMLRMWHKLDPLEDAKKASWYLLRLIDHMESNETVKSDHRPAIPSWRHPRRWLHVFYLCQNEN